MTKSILASLVLAAFAMSSTSALASGQKDSCCAKKTAVVKTQKDAKTKVVATAKTVKKVAKKGGSSCCKPGAACCTGGACCTKA